MKIFRFWLYKIRKCFIVFGAGEHRHVLEPGQEGGEAFFPPPVLQDLVPEVVLDGLIVMPIMWTTLLLL